MRNFFVGLFIIFLGTFAGYFTTQVVPLLVTGTDAGSVIQTTIVPIAIFFVALLAGLFVMIGRKGRKQQ